MNPSFISDLPQAQLYRRMDELGQMHPALSRFVIGKSCVGRPITAFSIGQGQPVLWAGAFHGSERLTAYLLLCALEDILTALQEGRPLAGLHMDRVLDACRLIVVPLVNPDGCFIARDGYTAAGQYASLVAQISHGDTRHYNANARGVDINHNFPAGWEALHQAEQNAGLTGPAKGRFGGFAPASEPETVALIELCRTTAFRHVMAFHSQGQVIYYPAGPNAPAHSREMADILAGLSGYALEQPTGLAVGGGFKDYFCRRYARPGFTVEVGSGENPLPMSRLPAIYEQLRPMLMTSLLL